MYSVYKITNLLNQKSYIGSSTRIEKRWQQHKNDAFNPNNEKYNYPLYQAFRKYGIENFSFIILRDNFSSIEEMQDYEEKSILAHNTLSPNGYNQTLFTNSNTIASENTKKHIAKVSKQCALVDTNNNIIETYVSYHAAARAQGWDGDARATTIQKICKGDTHSCNGLIFRALNDQGKVIIPEAKTRKRRTAIYGIKKDDVDNIVYYDSISEAARQENISRSSISKCLAGSTRYSSVGGRIWRKVGE